jgi:DNA-directed RNA polymerase sigma subunit (sigma70/sigma32)
MKLTDDKLKELIHQVLEDLNLIMPLPYADEPLLKEPLRDELPPLEQIDESVETQQKIFSVLKQMKAEDRDRLFRRFGYYKRSQISKDITSNILQNISDINRAQKGDL